MSQLNQFLDFVVLAALIVSALELWKLHKVTRRW